MKPTHRQRGSLAPFLLLLLIPGALSVLLLTLLVDRQPAVPHPGRLDAAALAKIEQLIVEQSPETLYRNGEQRIELTTQELNLLTAFLTQNMAMTENITVRIQPSTPLSRVEASIPVLAGPIQHYVNLSADIRINDHSLELHHLRIGRLDLPQALQTWLSTSLRDWSLQQGLDSAPLVELRHAVRQIEILDDGVALQVAWQLDTVPQLQAQARQSLLDHEDRERLLHYYELAREVGQDHEQGDNLYLWMTRLFESARHRSNTAGQDAIAENRGVLLALALYVNRVDPRRLLSDAPDSRRTGANRLPRLEGRRDLARHFLTSAAIGATTGGAMAHVLANSKELHDARYGSGFNLTDIAANRAGIRLGQRSVSDAVVAATLQQRLAKADSDRLFMPALSTAGSSPASDDSSSDSFQAMATQLDLRIDALPLYRKL